MAFLSWAELSGGLGFSIPRGVQPELLHGLQKKLDNAVFNRAKLHAVKLIGVDACGNDVAGFTGTMAHNNHPLILTAGSALGFRGSDGRVVVALEAVYTDGFREPLSVEVPSVPWVNLCLLKGSRPAPKVLLATTAQRCDTIYVLGYPRNSNDLSIDKGMVAPSAGGEQCYETALADEGWLGGAVLNGDGKLVGLVSATEGQHMQRVRMVSFDRIHDFLAAHQQPLLQQ